MTYRRRMIFAAVCSVFVHIAVLSPGGCRARPRGLAFSRHAPIAIELHPDAPRPSVAPQRLVDVVTPALEPVDATDLIAEGASKAADRVFDDADTGAPRVEKIDPFERIATAGPSPAQPAAPPGREPVETPDLERGVVAAALPEAVVPASAPEGERSEDADPAENAAQAAAADPPLLGPREASGRVEGGVKRTGLLTFEAMESEIAPYLKEIRQRVERNWRTALHVRYSGTSRTRAVLDCAIGPDGHIIEVRIVEAGDSATFAPLCRQAIEDAGPFEPFPFKVPEVYRSQNLEIRWTFSFLE